MGRVIAAFAQFFDGSGAPLQRGWLRFLESGSNNTDKNTFYDPTYQIPNANPVQLDGEGRCPNVFGTGDYRVISYINDPEDEDSPGEQIQQFDPVSAEAAAETGGGAGSFGIWDALETYSLGDIVTYNTVYYRSLITGNLDKNPAIEEDSWERVDFLRWYNSTITYSQGDLVFYQYNLYMSKQALNVGNTPQASPAYWRPVATGYYNVYLKTGDYEILPTEYDSIFVLADTVVAAHQFDLPAMDATTDRFKVSIYNASDYELTVNALGSTIWIDTSGDIVLTKGAMAEFIYSNDLGQWLVFGSVGPTLGAQDIGTPTTPVENIYADFIFETVMPDDEKLYFGTDSDFFIEYDSAADVFNFNDFWQITPGGNFLPDATNPAPNIGSATAYVANAYITTLYGSALNMPDTGLITIGVGNALRLSSNDSLSFIYSDNVALYIGTTTANALRFVANNTEVGYIDSSGQLVFASNIFTTGGSVYSSSAVYIGAANHFAIAESGISTVFNDTTGFLLFRTLSNNVLLLETDGNARFYNDLRVNGNFNSIGQIQYGSITDGITVLGASILEINQRCDGIPFIQSYYNPASINIPAGSTAAAGTLNLGTVNALSYAILEIGAAAPLTGFGIGKTAGSTASVYIGGHANPLAVNLEYLYAFATVPTITLTIEVVAGGSLVLELIGHNAGAAAANLVRPFIRVTWIKKT